MAIDSKIKYIYDTLKGGGADVGTPEEFQGWFLQSGSKGYDNRKYVYDTLTGGGADAGESYEEFAGWLGLRPKPQQIQKLAPKPQQAPEPAKSVAKSATQQPIAQQKLAPQAQKSQPAPQQLGATSPVQSPQQPVAKPAAPQKPQPAPVQKPAQARATAPKVQPKPAQPSAPVPTSVGKYFMMRRGGVDFAVSDQEIKRAGGIKAWADQNSASGAPIRVYMKSPGSDKVHVPIESALDKMQKGYRFSVSTAKNKPQAAVNADFNNDVDKIIRDLWSEAEQRTKGETEKAAKKAYDDYMAVGGGREARTIQASDVASGKNVARLRNFDIAKLAQGAVDKVLGPVSGNGAAEDRHRAQYRDLYERVYQQIYNFAVNKKAPKSTLDFFLRKVMDANTIAGLTRGLARARAGVDDTDEQINERVMANFGKKHMAADIAGTVAGMTADPAMLPATMIGGAATAQTAKFAGKMLLPNVARGIASKAVTGTLDWGIPHMIGGAANFATFNAVKNIEGQVRHGGYVGVGGTNTGYSGLAVAGEAAHGFLLGGVLGVGGKFIGNAGNKLTDAALALGGRAGTLAGIGARSAEFAAGRLYNGTVFAADAWQQGGDWDLWHGVATDFGFNAKGMVMGAAARINSIRPVKEPRTLAERNHNNMSLWERMSKTLASHPTMVPTKEEEAILREKLYLRKDEELNDLFYKRERKDHVIPLEGPEADGVEAADYEYVGEGSKLGLDGYETLDKIITDKDIPETLRAKLYFLATKKHLPPSSIMGSRVTKSKNGRTVVEGMSADGSVVTRREFKDEKSARGEIEAIHRQAELNTIDIGERYADASVQRVAMHDVKSEVALKNRLPEQAVVNIYNDYLSGKQMSEGEMAIVEDVQELTRDIVSNYDSVSSAGIRAGVEAKYDVDLQKAVKTEPSHRSDAENKAVVEYGERLYSEADRTIKANSVFSEEVDRMRQDAREEQREAWRMQMEGRLLYGRMRDASADTTPEARAEAESARVDIEAINARVDEARAMCAEAFGDDADYWMERIDEDVWGVVDMPTLSEDQRNAVLHYINSMAAQDGVRAAHQDDVEARYAEVENSVARRTHQERGTIQPATLKVDDRRVYIVNGDVVMLPDGTGVDHLNSSESVIVCDAETGEYKFVSPSDIWSVDEEIDPHVELNAALEQIDAEQSELFPPVDAENLSKEAYDEMWMSDGADVVDATQEGVADITDSSGNITESASDITESTENITNPGRNITENAVLEPGNIPNSDNSVENVQHESALSRIPVDEESGEPMFEQAPDYETAWRGLVELVGGDAKDAAEIAQAQADAIAGDLRELTNKPPKLSGSPMQMVAQKREHQDKINDLQGRLDTWNGILGATAGREATDGINSKEDDGAISDSHRLSDEMDDNGLPFLLSSNDTVEFGKIRESEGIPSLPIRLSEGYNKKTEDGRNIGYGYDHIKEGHGDQILEAGFSSVLEFIEHVSSNYQKISKGQVRKNGSQTYIIEVVDDKSNVLYIEISQDGQYWTINSGGVFRKGYTKNKELVEPLPAVEASPVAADDKVQERGDNPMSGNSISTNSSEGKVNDYLSDKQESGTESLPTGEVKTEEAEVDPTEAERQQAMLDYEGQNDDEVQKNIDFYEKLLAEAKENTPWDKDTIEIREGIIRGGKLELERKAEERAKAEREANEPTEAQKKAGNYKKKHIRVDGHEISIENERGSVRRGTDADGKQWETEMKHDYGYIRGTESEDGDHIDVFLSEHPEQGDVFVVDQVKEDGTFDEHKVMYGFGSEQEARDAYLSNYEDGWQGLGNITHVSKEEFKKWIQSSKRKTKPFAEYKSVNSSNNLFQYYGGSLRDLISEAKDGVKGIVKKLIAPVSIRLQDDLFSHGLEISADYNHVIDNNAIRHALKNHGGKSEEKRGQVPLTEEDFERIEDIVENYDNVTVESGKREGKNIIYSKTYLDGTTIFVEEQRTGRRELAAVTMWKLKKSTLTDAKSTETPQISDLGATSEHKVNTFVSEKQAVEAESLKEYHAIGRYSAELGMSLERQRAENFMKAKDAKTWEDLKELFDGFIREVLQEPESVEDGQLSQKSKLSILECYYVAANRFGKLFPKNLLAGIKNSAKHLRKLLNATDSNRRRRKSFASEMVDMADEASKLSDYALAEEVAKYERVRMKYIRRLYSVLSDDLRHTIGVGNTNFTIIEKDYKDLLKQIAFCDNELKVLSKESKRRALMQSELAAKEEKYSDMVVDGSMPTIEELMASTEEEEEEPEDTAKYREEAGDVIEDLFNRAIKGEFIGKPESVGRLTAEGREYLERLSGMELRSSVDFVLNPSDLLHIYRRHFGDNEMDGRNIPLTVDDIREMSDIIARPDKVVFTEERAGQRRKLFFFLKESTPGSYNLLEVYADRRGNLTSKSFFKSKEGVSQRVISLQNDPTLYVRDGWGNPLDGAKLPIFFESTTDESRKLLAKEYETDRGAMEAHVKKIASKLGVPVRIVTDEAEIAQFENRRRRRAKGWFDRTAGKNGEIVVVLPNHSNVADAEETIVHEAVAHYGLRKLIGDEKFDAFLDEVFAHASAKIKADIEHRTQMEYERWLFAETRKRGGGAVAAAYATVEAEARKDNFRRTATEEYMADMAEKIADDGFENMDREEQTLWGRVKAKVMKFIEAILKGLKIGKSVKLTDKDIAYILYRSWKNLRDGGGSKNGGGIRPTALDIAEDAVMREKTGYNKTGGSKATTGESAQNSKTGLNPLASSNSEHIAKVQEKIELAKVSERFDSDIERYERGEIPAGYRFELGMPSAELRSAGFPNLPISMRESLLSLKSGLGRHPFAASELLGLVNAIQKPIAVFEYTNDNVRNLIVDLKSGDKHFLVGVTLNFKRDGLEINSVSGLFPKDNHEWIKWIQDRRVIRIDQKEKVLSLIDSLRMNPAEADRIGLNLDSVAKIVENFENPTIEGEENEGDVLYRDGDDVMTKDPVLARALYEQRVATSSYQVREAGQDSVLGLMEAYMAIEKASGRKRRIEEIAGPENAYLWENRLSSKNYAEQVAYEKLVIRPMLKEVSKLVFGKKVLRFGSGGDSRKALIRYMMAKHGLERNAVMRAEAVANGMKHKRAAAKDFAGLTGLAAEAFGKPVDTPTAEAWAAQQVNTFELNHDTNALWAAVNAATKATLSKLYEGGVMSKETHDKVAGMYQYYIPLRGWAETTADEVYGYLMRHDEAGAGSVMKKAYGRRSIADDPIATIAMMGQHAIAESNRNRMKQAFFNYVRRNPSDLVSVSRLWLKFDDTSGEWVPALPDGPRRIEEGDDAATVAQKWAEHERHMEALAQAEPDKYKRGRQARKIPFKMGDGNLREHMVFVKCGDDTYVMTINGSPRGAQALNGLTNPHVGDGFGATLYRAAESLVRFASGLYTQFSPEFMLSNFQRDAAFTNTISWAKESPEYAWAFNRNFAMVMTRITHLLHLYERGKLDMNNELHRHFRDFILNGGETGYTSIILLYYILAENLQSKKYVCIISSIFQFV